MAGIKKPHDPVGTSVAALFICLAVALIWQTGSMTPMGSVFPITISVAMIVFSALLILRNLVIGTRGRPAGESSTGEQASAEGEQATMRRAAFFAVMVLWIVAIAYLGFFVASLAGFVMATLVALHERVSLRQAAFLGLTAVVVVGGFYLVMREVLLIPMPRGLFF